MNALKSALNILRVNNNVRDGLIITKDGMIIESSMDDKRKAEKFSAYSSQIALTIKGSMKDLGFDNFIRYVINTNEGKLYIVDLGQSLLVALTDLEVNSERINVALFQAANLIKKSGRLDI